MLERLDVSDVLSSCVMSESWEYADADTQCLTHNIHRYSGKFIPQIAARAIDLLTSPGDIILDPYCGSGTVLVEAASMGRAGMGVDLSPLAVLIAKTKITPISKKGLSYLRDRMTTCVRELGSDEDLRLFEDCTSSGANISEAKIDPRVTDEWYQKWFRREILWDLVRIELAIQEIPDAALQRVALVAFSDILRKSSNAHSGYPNVMFDKNAGKRHRPGRPFLKSLDRICEMIKSLPTVPADWSNVDVQQGDATALEVRDSSIDAVISHPPYIGSIPYAEYGALSLKWLGHDPQDLDRRLTGGRRQSSDVLERFNVSFAKMLGESYRVLRPARYAFLMVGNPVVRGELIDLAEMTIDLAGAAGFQLVVRTERQGVNRRANRMGAEHLLFFQKPAG